MSTADVELGPVDYVVVASPAGQANFRVRWPGGGWLPVWTRGTGLGVTECPALQGLTAPGGFGR